MTKGISVSLETNLAPTRRRREIEIEAASRPASLKMRKNVYFYWVSSAIALRSPRALLTVRSPSRFCLFALRGLRFGRGALIVFKPGIFLIVFNHNHPPRPLGSILWRQRPLGSMLWRQQPVGSILWRQTFGENKTKNVGGIK